MSNVVVPVEWPPSLATLKADAKITDPASPAAKAADDAALQRILDAAVVFVEARRRDLFYGGGELNGDGLPEPDADVVLGTIRLAFRWHVRRRSPDMLIEAAELGNARVPGIDPDIERLLRIGRSKRPGGPF